MIRILFAIVTFGLLLCFIGSSDPVDTVHSDPDRSSKIPFIQKRPDLGGEACLTMVLRGLGNDIDQDFVFDQCGIDPLLGRGAVTRELVLAAKQLGFDTGPVWYSLTNDSSRAKLWQTIQTDLAVARPVIVVRRQQSAEQFLLLLGYDSDSQMVIYHDPNRPDGASKTVDRDKLLASMRLHSNQPDELIAVAIRCEGTPTGLKTERSRFSNADYALHIRELRSKLPNNDFQIVLQKPFVVVGDAGIDSVRKTATGTVKWAVDRLKQAYFQRDPNQILDIWLFKDADSYQRHNLELFGSKPSTPYGYYSPRNRSLVMDISTGGGTLVHEIVHPFMESNFTGCPAWFNEGLASLYEQSNSRDGRIVGLTNWRLRGLQRTIADGRLGSFADLCATSTREFYDGAGINYAQARYLCYYLQEQGLLNRFYHRFVANADQDPTGYQTLQTVLGRRDMEKFQQEWEAWVQRLRFPSP